ncbi:MAG: hypothetical protein JXR96_24040 [Deltaproteobacteria bacterium]|nr:hypothetical protein [Deltaproteobacteria bacterium]
MRQLLDEVEQRVALAIEECLLTALPFLDSFFEPEAPADSQAQAPEFPITEQGDPAGRKTCTVEGCSLPARARGLCSKHYQRLRYAEKRREENRDGPRKTEKRGLGTCSIEGCDAATYAKGMCGKHFMEWVRAQKALKSESPDDQTEQVDPAEQES